MNLKPSEIPIDKTLFMPNALGKAELEQAAALCILVLADQGDEWHGVLPKQIYKWVEERYENPEWRMLVNPFFNPDFEGLVTRGFAEWDDTMEAGSVRGRAIKLTEETIRKCAKSVGVVIPEVD